MFRALLIGNDDPRAFSVGADLGFFARMIADQRWSEIDSYLARGQDLFLRLKYAPFPVVAAVHGFALGGGCEFMLHAHATVAHAELKAGLPEVKVGLIPGWGGCTQLLLRAQSEQRTHEQAATVKPVFDTIFAGNISGSALNSRAGGVLRAADSIVMDRRVLIAAAARKAAEMADAGYVVPERAVIAVGGASAKAEIMNAVHVERGAGRLTQTDVVMADILADVLTGGDEGDPLTEADFMVLERAAIAKLVRRPTTRARIDHMLETGKPLRN